MTTLSFTSLFIVCWIWGFWELARSWICFSIISNALWFALFSKSHSTSLRILSCLSSSTLRHFAWMLFSSTFWSMSEISYDWALYGSGDSEYAKVCLACKDDISSWILFSSLSYSSYELDSRSLICERSCLISASLSSMNSMISYLNLDCS